MAVAIATMARPVAAVVRPEVALGAIAVTMRTIALTPRAIIALRSIAIARRARRETLTVRTIAALLVAARTATLAVATRATSLARRARSTIAERAAFPPRRVALALIAPGTLAVLAERLAARPRSIPVLALFGTIAARTAVASRTAARRPASAGGTIERRSPATVVIRRFHCGRI